ncbi:DUF6093 family protein [Streptomyces sp. NBC_01353]|uniref:DUF6093 family protein n=1 Tax=Streptomyces sp. NBC_01353 TaxID=2903835 RepID=UPI002E370AE2|nr:DUF6093 family protein [Streptomyces sp. NBC_01353]
MAGLDDVLADIGAWVGENILLDTVRIEQPGAGEPVLNETTGQLEYPDGTVLYEGLGAVLPVSGPPVMTVVDANLPWPKATRSAYRLLTPLSAPIPPKDAIVTVTAVHNPANAALLGRSWTCTDQARAGTAEAVRITQLDQQRSPA